MRLIDADELRKAFEEVYPLATNEMGGAVNKRIYDIVDNAPTVFTQEDIDNVLELSYISGQQHPERPKGKWRSVGFEKGYAFCICSNCGNTTRLYRDSKNEFCCIADIRNKVIACLYCGAKMDL